MARERIDIEGPKQTAQRRIEGRGSAHTARNEAGPCTAANAESRQQQERHGIWRAAEDSGPRAEELKSSQKPAPEERAAEQALRKGHNTPGPEGRPGEQGLPEGEAGEANAEKELAELDEPGRNGYLPGTNNCAGGSAIRPEDTASRYHCISLAMFSDSPLHLAHATRRTWPPSWS